MNEVTKRFVETYKAMGLTGYKMGKSSNIITKQKISNIEQGITDASIDIISDFCSTYLTVSCDYTLTGNGPMFKSQEGETENHDILTPEDRKVIQEAYQDIIEERDRRIAILEKEIIELKIKYRKTEVK